jgi:hypothetical protein
MTTQQLGMVAIAVVVGIAGYLAFAGGLFGGGYAYACADGTEFRLSPSKDRATVTIDPLKSAAVFPTKTLERVEGEVGTTYVGGSVVLFGKGTDLQLITAASSTVCKPQGDGEPLDWGA